MKFIKLLEDNDSDFKQLRKDMKIKPMEKVYNDLIDMLKSKEYEDSVDFIETIVKEPKLKFMLSLGFGGEYADTELKLSKVSVPVYKLIPTQNEIGTDETLKYICTDAKNVKNCFEKSVVIKRPIVIFQNTFIIDGHHRWSEVYAINRNANIECINIDGKLSVISILKAIQATIGSNLGTLNTKEVEGKNLFKLSDKQILDYVKSNMTEKSLTELKKYYDDPIEEIVKNCIQLRNTNKPYVNAQERGEMPQTSKDPNLFTDLKNGVTKV